MEETFSETREDHGPRIPKAKLEGITFDPKAAKVSIFFKSDKNSASQFVQTMQRDVAMIFCDRIRTELLENNGKSFTVNGCDLEALKTVLAWIQKSAEARKCERLDDLDPESPKLLLKYANLVHAASYLGIPDRDLGAHVIKRMLNTHARKTLMSWDEVEYFLYSPKLAICNQDIRDVAAASVFWGWWNAKLTDDETPDDMDYLCELREHDAKFDQDLKDWCARNEEDVRRKWAEKKAKKNEEQGQHDGHDQYQQGNENASLGDGWNTISANPHTVGNGWSTDQANHHDQGSAGGWDQLGGGPGVSAGNAWAGKAANVGDKVSDSGVDMAADDHAFPPTMAYNGATGSGGYHTPLDTHNQTFSNADMGFEDDGGDWADQVNRQDQVASQQW